MGAILSFFAGVNGRGKAVCHCVSARHPVWYLSLDGDYSGESFIASNFKDINQIQVSNLSKLCYFGQNLLWSSQYRTTVLLQDHSVNCSRLHLLPIKYRNFG